MPKEKQQRKINVREWAFLWTFVYYTWRDGVKYSDNGLSAGLLKESMLISEKEYEALRDDGYFEARDELLFITEKGMDAVFQMNGATIVNSKGDK